MINYYLKPWWLILPGHLQRNTDGKDVADNLSLVMLYMHLLLETQKYICIFHHFLHRGSVGSWNPSLWKTGAYLPCVVNIIAVIPYKAPRHQYYCRHTIQGTEASILLPSYHTRHRGINIIAVIPYKAPRHQYYCRHTIQGTEASATMILTKFPWDIPVSAPQGLMANVFIHLGQQDLNL